MAEIVLPAEDAVAAMKWVTAQLKKVPASRIEHFSGVAGSVDAYCEKWRTADGLEIEVWSDNWFSLSLSGDSELVTELSERYALECGNG